MLRVPASLAVLVVSLVVAAPAAAPAQDGVPPGATIYSSLPLQGDARAQSRSIVDAMKLAVQERGGRAGGRDVKYVSLDDSTKAAGKWEPGRVSRNARTAAEDGEALGYLGEFNSGATAISLPILNEAGLAQVSPSNTYTGLTRREAADLGEPGKYYPSGERTYARVVPADHHQADAIVAVLRSEEVRRIAVVSDGEVYGAGLASMVVTRAKKAGIRVVKRVRIPRRGRSRRPDGAAAGRALNRVQAGAMVYGGITQNDAADLFDAVARKHPAWRLVGPDGVAESAFTRALSTRARARTLVTNPTFAEGAYPEAAQAFFARFRAEYGRAPEPYAVYGYEAMALMLDAIDRAAASGRLTKAAVVAALRATKDRDSVLGRYSLDRNGDTTLGTYGVFDVTPGGALTFARVIGG